MQNFVIVWRSLSGGLPRWILLPLGLKLPELAVLEEERPEEEHPEGGQPEVGQPEREQPEEEHPEEPRRLAWAFLAQKDRCARRSKEGCDGTGDHCLEA